MKLVSLRGKHGALSGGAARHAHNGGGSEKRGVAVKVYAVIGCIYLALLIGVTVYSQTAYTKSLPLAVLHEAGEREADYAHYCWGVIYGGNLYVELDVSSNMADIITLSVMQPGSRALLTNGNWEVNGTITGFEEVGALLLRFEIVPEDAVFHDGEHVDAVVYCGSVALEYPAVPASALHPNPGGLGYVIYLVEAADGPWGQRYVLSHPMDVMPWPDGGLDGYCWLFMAQIDKPVVAEIDADYAYPGTEVRIS